MGAFASPPKSTKASFRQGEQHVGVAALQLALKAIGSPLTIDGNFGARTDQAVRAYQSHRGLAADGIAGTATQARISQGFERQAEEHAGLPSQLLRGMREGESGSKIAAVNWSVTGGVDCGFFQRRVYGPPWTEHKVRDAFNAKLQADLAAAELFERQLDYRELGNGVERSWRLAVLAHNYPWGAYEIAHGRTLSGLASWVPLGVKFDDGAPVRTKQEWCAFYALGSREHRHSGRMTKYAFGIP